MSNPHTHNSRNQKAFNPTKTNHKQKFVPKIQNPNPTLTTSLRQSNPTSSASSSSSISRVQLGESGEWVSGQNGNFVRYLPQDEAVAAGLGANEGGLDPVESQRVVDALNRELSRLLKLGSREFWRQVASDTSLHEFLDSFLQFRSRWYDFPYHGAKGIVAGVIVGEYELSRRVFMVLYRISSNRDPGARAAESLSPNDHGVLLQEKKLIDLPKLLDICAIYGHENEDLTRLLVGNALRAQPWIHDNLISVLAHFLGIINTMQQRCNMSLEMMSASGSDEYHGSNRLHSDFLEVMDFINDAIVAMDAFVSAYRPAAVFFSCPVETSNGNEELLSTLAKLHDSLLQNLRQGFQTMRDIWEDEMITNVAISLKMLSTRLVNFGWKLLEICYLSGEVFEEKFILPVITKMFPAKVEDPSIRSDILVQTFREISELSLHIQMNQNTETYIQCIEKQFNLIRRLQNLCESGWVVLDAEQFHYLFGITAHSPKGNIKEPSYPPDTGTSKKAEIDEDSAILESKISQIKDIFPDYGNGFLAACLEVYNQNPEEVIQRILEGTLHEDLLALDTSIEKMPPRRALITNRNDKGKGKLVETSTSHTSNKVEMALDEQMSSTSSSSIGRYVRKTKDDLYEPAVLNARDKKDSAITSALISQYEYEDEYDDSFDDLNVNVVGSGLDEDETYGDKIRPNTGRETESGSSGKNPSNSKWGSRKKPQFYVKDGKNYSYKVEGALAVANANEAYIVNQTQSELIYGLGRGGNIQHGAVKRLTDANNEQDNRPDPFEMEGRGNMINPRGRGRRGGGRMEGSYNDDQSDVPEGEGTVNVGYQRGRGRRGGGRNHNRKDRAMNKHVSSLNRY